ncbi:hypothetical protein [Desulfobacula sp.]|uniref:hypothetical protein n=1 Tax=Desulfobacula sp. TaxID=2593537 RepID=UPI002634C16F|nr:hypothetical protein [Desulfobacula sp.]
MKIVTNLLTVLIVFMSMIIAAPVFAETVDGVYDDPKFQANPRNHSIFSADFKFIVIFFVFSLM